MREKFVYTARMGNDASMGGEEMIKIGKEDGKIIYRFPYNLAYINNIKHKAILMLIYSAGLRVSEVVKLKLEDIDTDRKMIRIKGGKGRKGRYTILSDIALDGLNEYIHELLGHKSSKTTEISTHVSNKNLSQIKSPLDRLFENKKGGSVKDDLETFWREKIFVQRDVYTKYFRYTAKMGGYTKFVYTAKLE